MLSLACPRSALLREEGEALRSVFRLTPAKPQVRQGGLYLDVLRIPLQSLFEITLGLGRQSRALADQPRILPKRGVDPLTLQSRLAGLYRLPHARRDARCRQRQVVTGLGVVGIVLDGHVAVLVC